MSDLEAIHKLKRILCIKFEDWLKREFGKKSHISINNVEFLFCWVFRKHTITHLHSEFRLHVRNSCTCAIEHTLDTYLERYGLLEWDIRGR